MSTIQIFKKNPNGPMKSRTFNFEWEQQDSIILKKIKEQFFQSKFPIERKNQFDFITIFLDWV